MSLWVRVPFRLPADLLVPRIWTIGRHAGRVSADDGDVKASSMPLDIGQQAPTESVPVTLALALVLAHHPGQCPAMSASLASVAQAVHGLARTVVALAGERSDNETCVKAGPAT